MPIANDLAEVLETTEPDRLATGFIFTEGPLWHPDGYWYFVDLRRNQLLRLTPGKEPELVRTTIGGNGTTFDLQGRLIVCEGDDRRLTRMLPDGKVESLVDNYRGGRFNRPNDVICHSNGCLYFTDPDKRRPYHEREIPGPAGEDNLWDGARVYRLAPDGGLSVLANCEYPNGLALSPAGAAYGTSTTSYLDGVATAQYCPGFNNSNILAKGSITSKVGTNPTNGTGYFKLAGFCPAPLAPYGDPGNPLAGIAPATAFGNSGIGGVLGPGQFNWDISILKNTKLTERVNMQFRADFYNAFNHPQFADPGGGSFGTVGFEDVTATNILATEDVAIIHTSVNPRLIQFGLRFSF